MPQATQAGVSTPLSITALDPYGNVVTSDNVTLSLSSSDSTAALPASVTLSNGKAYFNATFTTAGDITITATSSDGSLQSTGDVSVEPAAPAQVAVTAPSLVGEGTPFDVTLTLQDQYGNTVTDYPFMTPTTVDITGPMGVLTVDNSSLAPTIDPGDNGVHTYLMAPLNGPGSQTFTAIYNIPTEGETQFTVLVVSPSTTQLSASSRPP